MQDKFWSLQQVFGPKGKRVKPTGVMLTVSRLLHLARQHLDAGNLDDLSDAMRETRALAPRDALTLTALAQLHVEAARLLASQARDADPSSATKVAEASAGLDDALAALSQRLNAAPAGSLPPTRQLPAAWPNKPVVWKSLDRIFRRFVLAELEPEPGVITKESRVLTMGSCFAHNMSIRLAEQGVQVHHQIIKEDFNTTFANEQVVRWAVEGPASSACEALDSQFGAENRAVLLENLSSCEVYIFSLGVAPAAFDGAGNFVLTGIQSGQSLPEGVRVRTTTPDENARNVLEIIRLLRSVNPKVQVFLTLSPVPLAGSAERKSAILADCVSKSSLRMAIDTVMGAEIPGVRYWPSFEMVKWWGPHLVEGRAFGDGDRETRHVSPWMVAKVMDLFLEYYGDDSLQPAAGETAPAV